MRWKMYRFAVNGKEVLIDHDPLNDSNQLITICSNCYSAACIMGISPCDKSGRIETIDIPVEVFSKLKNKMNWKE